MVGHIGKHGPQQHDHEGLGDTGAEKQPGHGRGAGHGQKEQCRRREQQHGAPQPREVNEPPAHEHPPQHGCGKNDLDAVVHNGERHEGHGVRLNRNALHGPDGEAVDGHAEENLPGNRRGIHLVEHARRALCRHGAGIGAARESHRDGRKQRQHDGRSGSWQHIEGHLERRTYRHGDEHAGDDIFSSQAGEERRPLQIEPRDARARERGGDRIKDRS